MEIALLSKGLSDQFGADNFAVVADQAAIGLIGHQRLSDTCDPKRKGEAKKKREQHQHNNGGAEGGADFSQHNDAPLSEVETGDGHVDHFDANERRDQAADTVNREVAAEQSGRACRTVRDAF